MGGPSSGSASGGSPESTSSDIAAPTTTSSSASSDPGLGSITVSSSSTSSNSGFGSASSSSSISASSPPSSPSPSMIESNNGSDDSKTSTTGTTISTETDSQLPGGTTATATTTSSSTQTGIFDSSGIQGPLPFSTNNSGGSPNAPTSAFSSTTPSVPTSTSTSTSSTSITLPTSPRSRTKNMSSTDGTSPSSTASGTSTSSDAIPLSSINSGPSSSKLLPTPIPTPSDASNSVGTSKSGFLSNKPAVIGTFTAVGIVVVAVLALLFFLCLKRRGGKPIPVRSERSLGSRGIDHDEGLMGYRDSEPNTPSVPGFSHHNDTGALAAGGAGATESASRGVRFTDATAENRSVDYGLLDDGRYSSEKDREFGYTGGDGRQATSYSYPSVSSSPSLGSTGLPPRGLSDAYYLGAGGTGGASGSDYTIDPNSSSNSFFPAQSMTSHTSNATTPPATATATSADQWANRALAKSNASALGKEVFSPFQSFQQFENLQQQEPISPRQSSYYRDSQFGDYFSSGGNGDDGAYSGIAIGYASQLSPAASPIPLPLPAQGEKDVDVNISEESDWRKFDGPKPGSPSALGREVFRGFGDRGNDGSSNSAYLFSQNRF